MKKRKRSTRPVRKRSTKFDSYPLPPRTNSTRTNITGKAFLADPKPSTFPVSGDGLQGPFTIVPFPNPTGNASQDYQALVTYFVQFVGAKLEQLNALQFNLTKNNHATQVQLMSNALGDLADGLNVGDAQGANPPQLNWPMGGIYSLSQNIPNQNFTSFTVEIFFEIEPTCRIVNNCEIDISATGFFGPLQPISSSSSFIAPGSSH